MVAPHKRKLLQLVKPLSHTALQVALVASSLVFIKGSRIMAMDMVLEIMVKAADAHLTLKLTLVLLMVAAEHLFVVLED